MMRVRNWTTVVLAAVGLLTAAITPVAADEHGGAPTTVEWSASLGTATAGGERWAEATDTPAFPDLVLTGTLTNTGTECYSVWTRFFSDFTIDSVTKEAEVCGAGAADVQVRHAIPFTETGYVAVCRGTENTDDCGLWESITYFPIESD